MAEFNIFPDQKIHYREVISSLNGFDDEFFNALMQGNIEGVQLLLRIVLRIPDLVILKNPKTQQYLKNIYGKSIRMDCYAESLKKRFNVEIQRRNAGAGAHRARYNASLLDASISEPGEDCEDLPDTCVIFITEHDIYKAGKPYYEIERVIRTLGVDFNDGSHILYVNGEYRGDDPIGWLMHDLHCTNPHEMHEGPLKERALYLKETKEGVRQMSDKIKEIRDEGYRLGEARGQAHGRAEGIAMTKESNAREMLLDGSLSVQKIAKFSGLSVDDVEKMKTAISSNNRLSQ